MSSAEAEMKFMLKCDWPRGRQVANLPPIWLLFVFQVLWTKGPETQSATKWGQKNYNNYDDYDKDDDIDDDDDDGNDYDDNCNVLS